MGVVEQIGVESRQALRQVGQQAGHQPFAAALREVRVPAAHVNGGHFQPHLCLDEHRNLAQAEPELAVGIWPVAAGVVAQRVERLERVQDL